MRRGLLALLAAAAGAAGLAAVTARPPGTPAALPPGGAARATAAERAALLRRWAPELRLDRRERHAPVAAEAFLAAARHGGRPAGRPAVHGRALADRDGRLWLQWWALWDDNHQDRGLVRTGRHEGDWELVQVALDAARRPAAATLAQHGWEVGCPARGRPVVWVAHGSHASYPRREEGDRPWPDPDDEARGDGRALRPRVLPFGAWVRRRERWGRTAARPVPGEAPSPLGPAFQRERFADPAALHRGARGCAAAPPPHPWPLRALLGAVLALVALALLRRSVGWPARPSTRTKEAACRAWADGSAPSSRRRSRR